jgi:hypothetical protein
MGLYVAIGGFVTQQPGTTVTWITTFDGFGADRRIVIQAPNIVDDVLGSVELDVVKQTVQARGDGGLHYLVTIFNPSARAVRYNLNIQDPL